ncbi:Enamine deaminase RidA, house cleaning of reactive enamine intermediates, YjgF/YER057c/UK114 family [Roseomonas rosea]|uniref:Enamine deaminase RidA, house cleaning of reactive enamine intermediates, YjgF/YER057c/UK114 family n=1 Tax=Muricoccus roseus TaxID=198092 RepID=A0A1M6AIB1_9PROT|nr:RidA family protein [Roseomonas rosea]SHI36216.1 Enamine deaminase RidA, house cleaning of reactive enamine intermediates, YjgF/YER057c/UK114 family [Roseomonas rosea]
MFEVVETGIVKSKGPINGTVKKGNLVLTAQVPKDPETGAIIPGDIETQTRRTLSNLKMAIEAAGGTLADVMLCQIYLVEPGDAAGMNAVYREFFQEPYPCRATVVVKELLAPGMRIELIATAQLG